MLYNTPPLSKHLRCKSRNFDPNVQIGILCCYPTFNNQLRTAPSWGSVHAPCFLCWKPSSGKGTVVFVFVSKLCTILYGAITFHCRAAHFLWSSNKAHTRHTSRELFVIEKTLTIENSASFPVKRNKISASSLF